MVELSIFREAVVERTRRIAGRSEHFQADGLFSDVHVSSAEERPEGWLPRVLNLLPESARENIRLALGRIHAVNRDERSSRRPVGRWPKSDGGNLPRGQ